MSSGRWLQALVGLLWVGVCALLAISVAAVRPGGPIDLGQDVVVALLALSFTSVGVVLVVRVPGNRIGWLLTAAGTLVAVGLGGGAIADQGLNVHPGTIPGAVWFEWVAQWASSPVTTLVAGFLPMLYPSGRLPSRRWRAVAIIGWASIATGVADGAFTPFSPGNVPVGVGNPLLASDQIQALLTALSSVFQVIGVPLLVLILASVVQRYRRSSGVERQQFKWFAFAATPAIAGFAVGVATGGGASGNIWSGVSAVAYVIALVASILMPVAIGIAILRYRLYEIDVVIRRTAVYVPLTALLAGIYAAAVGLLQRLFIATTGNPSDGAIVLSTLILATTFTPIKNALQGVVDRRFRDAEDIDRRLTRFTDSVAEALAVDTGRTLRAFLRVAVRATGAGGGRVYLAAADGERVIGETGGGSGPAAFSLPIALGTDGAGRLELDAHQRGRPYSDRERQALIDAGERLSAALGAPEARRPLPPDSPPAILTAATDGLD
ncbi:MAG TPA: hypothetical protein VKR30_10250 [Candidatus Limnocylindrales bacterium]|nr:hypothetical protein [Candidatus Limnocylindrales bacterium]